MPRRSGTAGIIVIILLLLAAAYLLGVNRSAIPQVTPAKPTTQPTSSSMPSPIASPSATLSPTPVASTEITLTATGFVPAMLTITKGETVTWINKSGTQGAVYSNPHPTHTDYPPLNLGGFPNGGTLTLTFPTAGTYGYHNHLNPSQTGTIIVK